ncbi:hypothetical protein CBM2631_A130039 [Cupriavidus taiwanensis]|nr:hypothetical protein CBM2588_A80115 [Cupriavidus taiwanensis]SOZ50988.1 hypothetical protein CBM2617_A110109 [Cupriavidus taiwanensis]SOZ76046.1 hypothetical protein CBM2622_A110104 [Cupriavidus taiwanensis]SOZ77270.1 hypothetical protein CBM2618_A140109 [Cupriavidus taiwanensis]SOZ82085.1 hypothetical protein CBM2621_A120107 [Cupriavidus taiwanensis]
MITCEPSDSTEPLEDLPLGSETSPSALARGSALPVVVKLLLQQPDGDDLWNIALLGYN